VPDFIVQVDDGRLAGGKQQNSRDDPLNVVVETKGYRGLDAQLKAETMATQWVPGVMHHLITDAITREHRIKEWRRQWKIRLIESMNPEWIDLFNEEAGEILDGPADVARRKD
jgi:hypothetical protein